MAKIVEDIIVIKFSKIVKDSDKEAAEIAGSDVQQALEQVAQELVVGTVLVPRMAGALSAYGGLFAAAQVDHLVTWVARCDSADAAELSRVLADLRASGERALGGEGVYHECHLACHYAGQTSEIWVPLAGSVNSTGKVGHADLAEVAERFHEAHQRERSFARRDESVHIIGEEVGMIDIAWVEHDSVTPAWPQPATG